MAATTSGYPLTIRLFGPMDVRVHGEPLPRLRSRKGYGLLALLVLRHGRPHPLSPVAEVGTPVDRSWLAGTLWPDSAERNALFSLRVSLTDLRGALGPAAGRLHSPTPRSLALDLSGAEVDVVDFDDATASQEIARLERAVDRYRGTLLEGCDEEWVFPERRSREEMYLNARARLAEHAIEEGDRAAAIHHLRLAVEVNPARETTQRALMKALAASGNAAEAGRVYRDLRSFLHRELNAAPDAETTALYQDIRTAELRAAGSSLSHGIRASAIATDDAAFAVRTEGLSHPLTPLIGRERELGEIRNQLTKARLVTLTGTGGVGKTRLAIQVAAEVGPQFADGVRFVELAALTDPNVVPQAVASVLNLMETPGQSLSVSLVEYLRPKDLLLVLDNCEHLLAACATLSHQLLQACPGLRMLATSRQLLGLAGERVWRTPALAVPPTSASDLGDAPPATLLEYGAVRLFCERAEAVSPSFALTAANAQAIVSICRRLEGMPLAIELAAARVAALSAETIAERLPDRFRLLVSSSPVALPRHQTLYHLVDWSYNLLSDTEQSCLGALSIFAGGWTLAAAEAVCVGDRIEAGQVMPLLASLVEKSLVQYEEQPEDGRYRLLETIRQYACERLTDQTAEETARRRHRDWFLALAEQAEHGSRGAAQRAWLERLEQEHDNLRAALAWCVSQGEAQEGLRLGAALGWFWRLRGYWSEGRDQFACLLALPGAQARTPVRGRTLREAGVLADHVSENAEAVSFYEESLAIAQEAGDRHGGATVLRLLGEAAWGRYDPRAKEFGEESLAIFRELGDRRGIADALILLGGLASHRQGADSTQALWEESLAIHRKLGDLGGAARSLVFLGRQAYGRGDDATAERCWAESMAIIRDLEDKRTLGNELHHAAWRAIWRREYATARMLEEESLEIRRQVGYKRWIADSLSNLGGMAHQQGDDVRAWQCYEECATIQQELGRHSHCAWTLLSMANLALDRGDDQESRALLARAQSMDRGYESLGRQGELLMRLGDHGAGRSCYEARIAWKREEGEGVGLAWALVDAGYVGWCLGDVAVMHTHAREALQLHRDNSQPALTLAALENLAVASLAMGRPGYASSLLGAVQSHRDAVQRIFIGRWRSLPEPMSHAIRDAALPDAFADAWEAGHVMSLDEAIAFALDEGRLLEPG